MAPEILNVYVTDRSGMILADVDGSSTADVLAYYLRTRGIVEDATAEKIRLAVALDDPNLAYDPSEIVMRTEWDFVTAKLVETHVAMTHDEYAKRLGAPQYANREA